MNDSLKNYVQQITTLPTIPVIAQEILGLVNNDLISIDRLQKVIQNDPSISAKILSVANSVFFRIKEPSKTLNHAITRIGLDNVKNIAIGISLMSVLDDEKHGKAVDYRRIFNHSVTVGFIAKLLSKDLKLNISEEILINSMLHDLGFLVLNRYFSNNYMEVLRRFEKEKSLLETEKAVLDFNHTDIGAWLADKWNLPGGVLNTILYHHTPSSAKWNFKSVAVTHIADYLTTVNIMSPIKKDPHYPLSYSSLDILGITENDLKDIETKIVKDYFT